MADPTTQELYNYIKANEGTFQWIYSDPKGVPTVGVGTALIYWDDGSDTWNKYSDTFYTDYFDAAGLNLTGNPTLLSDLKDELDDAIFSLDSNNIEPSTPLSNISSNPGNTLFDWTGGASPATEGAHTSSGTAPLGIYVPTQADIATATAPDIATRYTELEAQFNTTPWNNLNTDQKTALFDMYWNSPDLIGPGLENAVNTGDQAQAWYEIRYRHLNHADAAVQERRARNADDFGIAPDSATPEDIAGALADLLQATGVYTLIKARDQHDPLEDTQPWRLVEANFADGLDIDFIQTGAGTIDAEAAHNKTDSNTANLIIGSSGADTIDAKGGMDFVYGGEGNDTIVIGNGGGIADGGADNDTYVIDPTVTSPSGNATRIQDVSGSDLIKVDSDTFAAEDVDIRIRNNPDGNPKIYLIFGEPTGGPPPQLPTVIELDYNTWAGGGGVEQIQFDDDTPMDLDDLPNWPDSYGPPSGPAQTPAWLDGPLGDFGDSKTLTSPLCLDLDGDGIELTAFNAATTTTFFDLNGDGFATQTAWVDADDGLLARDINGNGKIDDVTELFGSPTIDGFAKLALLDGNGDLIINQYDDAWEDLVIWQDANGDAITQDGELLTLASLDIVSIDLAGVTASTSTINGNAISHTSTFRYDNGSTDAIVDAWFVHDEVNTYFAGAYALDARALFLPTLRGFGQVADLHIAMTQNEDLLDLVDDLASGWDFDSWASPTNQDNDIADILYEWAGVQDASPTVYHSTLDSRQLDFMEALFADEWRAGAYGQVTTPGQNQAAALHEVWLQLFNKMKAAILIQVGANSLFTDDVAYDPYTGDFTGDFDLSEDAIDDLIPFASDTGVDTEEYWLEVARLLDATKGLDNLTGTENTWMNDAIYESDNSLTWTGIKDTLAYEPGVNDINGTTGNDTLNGTSGIDNIDGGHGDDTLYGGSGNDLLYGSYDHDTLYGESGNDTLDGGYGNDVLEGGDGDDTVDGGFGGNDTFVYTSGRDYYIDSGGTEKITLPSGITLNDLVLYRAESNDSLFITVGSLGDIEIFRHFHSSSYEIEEIEFYDTSTLDLTAIDEIDFYGTEGDDLLLGENGIDETLFGLAGNDDLRGYSGEDRLDGGTGNDTLQGGSGDDTFVMSEGFDEIVDYASNFNTLEIPAGFTLEDAQFIKNGNHINVYIADLGQVQINNQATGSGFEIDQLYFVEDESTVAWTDVTVEIRGTDGNDSLSGTNYNDILNGMGGDDSLAGGTGDDIYVFSDGTNVVQDTGGTETILFWEGYEPENIMVYRQEAYGYGWDDLVLEDSSGNKIIVESHFDLASREMEYVRFHDETLWDVLNMEIETWATSGNDSFNITDANGSVIRGFEGNDYITASGGGDDVIYGGAGNDTMAASTGNDIYVYESGLDHIDEAGGSDTLLIVGATINDISFRTEAAGYDLVVEIDVGNHEVYIDGQLQSSNYEIETISFDDGFYADLLTYSSWQNGTSGGDTISGTGSVDTIIGFAGNDDIDAGAGADAVHGGAGNDTINGDAGDDLLHGGAGDDLLYGDDGLDTLFGGAGADTFFFDSGQISEVDLISDFSTSDNDVINLADVLSYDSGSDVLTNFVQFADSGNDTTVSIDADGTGGFTQIATILGVTGITDEAALVTSGNLIVE